MASFKITKEWLVGKKFIIGCPWVAFTNIDYKQPELEPDEAVTIIEFIIEENNIPAGAIDWQSIKYLCLFGYLQIYFIKDDAPDSMSVLSFEQQ